MGMADSAKTGENARWRSRTARAHPIFDICDLILRSNLLKFQILSPLLPINLWLDFEKMTHCPFKAGRAREAEAGEFFHRHAGEVGVNPLSKYTVSTLYIQVEVDVRLTLLWTHFDCSFKETECPFFQ